MPDSPLHPVACWLEASQVSLVLGICERAGLEVVAAGTAEPGRARELAAMLGREVKPIDDLRSLLTSPDAAAVLLASPGEFASGLSPSSGSRAQEDIGLLADCRTRGVPVFSFEPMPDSLLAIEAPSLTQGDAEPIITLGPDASVDVELRAPASGAGLSGGAALGHMRHMGAELCPLLRQSRPVRDAQEILAQLGPPQLVAIECWSAPGQGSLGARLYDAIDAIIWLMGLPDQVAAAYVPAARVRSVHPLPGESLRGLDGELAATMRFEGGRAASVLASSRAGRFNRAMTLVSDKGRVRIYDDGLIWIDANGRTIDSSRDPSRIRGSGSSDDAALHAINAAAQQIRRRLDPGVPPDAPIDGVRVLAACGAALLSARTGESESPTTMLRMAGAS